MTSSVARHDIVSGIGVDPAVTDTIASLLAQGMSAWTEPDPTRRRDLLAACCASDVEYASPLGTAVGLDEYTDLIGEVHRAYPGFRPVRTSAVDLHHRYARLEWAFQDHAGRTSLTGLDVLTFTEQSRIASVTAFYGPTPPIRYVYGSTG
ncbi:MULTISPECIES: nuclear transport factor 2 family protein [unclassified Pseudofrankia]|uniref:nuclear transport factor 2 family protein n=1 Tax=unclassified Pseudofrankia TaxID=2994372 RepID=UPI0008DB2402|nr:MULTISPECIES: nuclear transport factor 2 family protein [unclassified Pseudofrankia]MDT3440819.1 nuclear transport factor 2 family protein [Pseudofrankia sp. BMG5.37]OHV43663.1 hypothetical protein BCD48_27135 [Pseudofrankia sp. BMG5.36]